MLSTLLVVALAGTQVLQNDNFTGQGAVNSAVSFPEYAGAGVLFTPDGGYPLTVVGIDVLAVTYSTGAPGQVGGYQVDVWTEADGLVTPPRLPDGGNYRPQYTTTVQFTTSQTQFNRVMLATPVTVTSGRVFVNVSQQLSTAMDNTTIAIDSAPLKPGANWWRFGFGGWTALELPDGGFFAGINHNWIVRLVLQTPDLPVTVAAVFPNSGPNSSTTVVGIEGTNFELAAKAYVGTNELVVTNRTGSTSLIATVPAGLAPGLYPVKVENSATNFGTLPNGFLVLTPDGGMGGGAGGGGGSGGGAGGSGGSGGGTTGALRLDDITPASGFNDETTKVVLTGDGFQTGAQVLVGAEVLDVATVRSAAVINADVPAGLEPGMQDVVVINLDGKRATLTGAFHVNARTKQGCGCGFTPVQPVLLLGLLALLRRRAAVTRGCPRNGEAPDRP